MKRTFFLTAFTLISILALNAQVQNRATVAQLGAGVPGNPLLLGVFGNTIDEVTTLFLYLNFGGRQVQYLSEKENVNLNQDIRREMERLNTRFLATYYDAAGFDAERGPYVYIIVNIYERVGNNIFRIASNR